MVEMLSLFSRFVEVLPAHILPVRPTIGRRDEEGFGLALTALFDSVGALWADLEDVDMRPLAEQYEAALKTECLTIRVIIRDFLTGGLRASMLNAGLPNLLITDTNSPSS
jgi:hypothetical protein